MEVRFGLKKIALTGGIASGKSMVQKHLEALNVDIIDADDITHDLYQHDQDLKDNIRKEFGGGVFNPDGTVNRDKLGNIVFNDAALMKKLTGWIHPKVRRRITDFFQHNAQEKFAVAVIPVLYESKLESQYDEVWVVKATRDQQIARLMDRAKQLGRPLTRQQAEDRINSQIPLDDKMKRADVVIDNSGTKDETKAQLDKLVLDLRA